MLKLIENFGPGSRYVIVIYSTGPGIFVNRPESEDKGGLRCHKSLATVLELAIRRSVYPARTDAMEESRRV